MKENIVPSYLPAASVTMKNQADGGQVTLFRPYEAFRLAELEAHAKQNERGALLQLGQRYFSGILGAEQDFQKAYDYLKRAAALGVQDAQMLLAAYYISEETGVLKRDPQKCIEMLTLAAENGSWKAMEKLAQAYRAGGNGVTPDHEKSYEWAVQAERMIRIYWAFYTQPFFVDFDETLKEILHAHTRISFALASCHADGIGTKRDLDAAMQRIDAGEQFVCQATGLAKVPMFEERRKQLQARVKKDEARAEKARKEAEKKK